MAGHFKLNVEDLKNLPYAFRRARIAGQNVLYGERTSKKLLRLIEKAVREKGLRFVFDEHEQRLPFDVEAFAALLAAQDVD